MAFYVVQWKYKTASGVARVKAPNPAAAEKVVRQRFAKEARKDAQVVADKRPD